MNILNLTNLTTEKYLKHQIPHPSKPMKQTNWCGRQAPQNPCLSQIPHISLSLSNLHSLNSYFLFHNFSFQIKTNQAQKLVLVPCSAKSPSFQIQKSTFIFCFDGFLFRKSLLKDNYTLFTFNFWPLGRSSNTTLRILSVRRVPPPLWTKFSARKGLQTKSAK